MRRGTPDGPARLEILVEEESADALLRPFTGRWIGHDGLRVAVRRFRGKPDLLGKLDQRLAGYADLRHGGDDVRVAVLVDCDDDECRALKRRLEDSARSAGLITRCSAAGRFHAITRIAVRELENWYFGDWHAAQKAFPKLSANPPGTYRGNPDVAGGKTSEAFARALRNAGIRNSSKPDWARRIGPHMKPDANRSPSLRAFVDGVRELMA